MEDIRSSLGDEQNKTNGFKTVLKIFKLVIKLLFPSYVLLQMNRNLGKAYSFYEDKWFVNQVKRNWIVTLMLTSIFLCPIGLGLMAIKGNHEFQNRFAVSKRNLAAREISKGFQTLSFALKEKMFVLELEFFGSFALFGLALGNIIIMNHKLVKDSKRLIKFFKNEGIINKENSNPTVLFTPIGVLVDISGSAPKEIALNERIWLGMNIQIKDWAEDPEKRSLVFFKTAFKLKARYDYFLPKDFK
jgi:hypothetical protein